MSEQKAIYGIIGNPLEHSLSPLMHNTAFKALGVDATYKPFPLKEDQMDQFFQDLKSKSSPIFGINVTVPYKEKAVEYLDNISPLVQRIMAVNTIVINKNRQLVGYNTDAPGFLAHLAELEFEIEGKRIAILGAGGSARTIIATLCMLPERPDSIRIYNRSHSRVENLLNDLGQRIDLSIVQSVRSVDDLNIELADFLINTTSLGLKENDECLVDEDLLHRDMLVYDLIYNPKETALLKAAKKQGAITSNGLGMLYFQGVLSFQHWANLQLDDEVKKKMRASLEKSVV